ncbi:permease [Herbaspirillum camelliae]|uniref:hypothetical protein n=1 Tax=Herbaspirillum camelliae TaxID=1892903 RepID=UPI00117A174D|nr:hypothetical protein [Herbaspirillum camelliae]
MKKTGDFTKATLAAHSENAASAPKLNWLSVAGLGIAFAISGSFSGWNTGLAVGGWGGMFIASLTMATFYVCLTQCVAELAAAHPSDATGMDSYAGIGLGIARRFFSGASIAVSVGFAVGACTSFIAAYCQSVFGFGGFAAKATLLVALI